MVTPVDDVWTDRLSDYLDDELDPEERRDVERVCTVCAHTGARAAAGRGDGLGAAGNEP